MSKKIFLCILLTLLSNIAYAQSSEYNEWIKKALAFYETKEYKKSADAFSQAFTSMGGKGTIGDRYNAACSWSLAGNYDSAFFQLNKLASKSYAEYKQLVDDSDLINLHTDKRWEPLCQLVKQNKEKAEANLNKPLVAILDTIFQNDQGGRMQLSETGKKYGQNSKEVKELWKSITVNDSLDLIKIENILDKYGWLGTDVIGGRGNSTLFLVIQHSDIKVQEKYLPMMREAVKNKKAEAASLALLEDRVALREGRKQIYGSQIRFDTSGKYWVSPLEDPDNVDKRRAEVGLDPLGDYLGHWNMTWDPVAYKIQLPEIEKWEKQ